MIKQVEYYYLETVVFKIRNQWNEENRFMMDASSFKRNFLIQLTLLKLQMRLLKYSSFEKLQEKPVIKLPTIIRKIDLIIHIYRYLYSFLQQNREAWILEKQSICTLGCHGSGRGDNQLLQIISTPQN